MAEKRRNSKFDRVLPGGEVFGLSAHRTRIARACKGKSVRRLGHGWKTASRRQELKDWHFDKLVQLDNHCRILSAIENTHDRVYVTEKIFDAFAIGAVPLYLAAPDHRVHGIVPEGSFLNLYGMTEETAVSEILAYDMDVERAERYAMAQARLARLFGSGDAPATERLRLRRSLVEELLALADADRA